MSVAGANMQWGHFVCAGIQLGFKCFVYNYIQQIAGVCIYFFHSHSQANIKFDMRDIIILFMNMICELNNYNYFRKDLIK